MQQCFPCTSLTEVLQKYLETRDDIENLIAKNTNLSNWNNKASDSFHYKNEMFHKNLKLQIPKADFYFTKFYIIVSSALLHLNLSNVFIHTFNLKAFLLIKSVLTSTFLSCKTPIFCQYLPWFNSSENAAIIFFPCFSSIEKDC